MAEDSKLFSYVSIKNRVENFVGDLNLPTMKKPLGFGEEYEFPTSVEQIKDNVKLGTLQLRLGAYLTYAQGVLGTEEMQLGTLESLFDLNVDNASHLLIKQYLDEGEKPPTKDMARSLAIKRDSTLKKLYGEILERKARITLLKAQIKIYEEQLIRLSREQSRRESEKV